MDNLYPSDGVMRYEFLKIMLANTSNKIADLNQEHVKRVLDTLVNAVKGEASR